MLILLATILLNATEENTYSTSSPDIFDNNENGITLEELQRIEEKKKKKNDKI